MSLSLRTAVVLAALTAVPLTAPAVAEGPQCVVGYVEDTPTEFTVKPLLEGDVDDVVWFVKITYIRTARMVVCI